MKKWRVSIRLQENAGLTIGEWLAVSVVDGDADTPEHKKARTDTDPPGGSGVPRNTGERQNSRR